MWLNFDDKAISTKVVIKIFCKETSIHVKYLNGTQEIVKTYNDEDAIKSAFTKICYMLENDRIQKWLKIEDKIINIEAISKIYCDEIFICVRYPDDTRETIKIYDDEETMKAEFMAICQTLKAQSF